MGSALGHYLLPLCWVGAQPSGLDPGGQVTAGATLDTVAAQLGDCIARRDDLPLGLRGRMDRDGLIVFDFAAWPSTSSVPPSAPTEDFEARAQDAIRRVRILNAHVACVATTAPWVQQPTPVAPQQTLKLDFEDGLLHAGGPGLHSFYLNAARRKGPFALAPVDWRLTERSGPPPIAADEASASFDLLADLLDATEGERERRLLRAELLLRSVADYASHTYPLAVVNAWTVIEGLLGDLWTAYLEDLRQRPAGKGGVPINASRLKKLRGSDVTAWHRAEFLSLAGKLPFTLYAASEGARKLRNKYLHAGGQVTGGEASDALAAAQELFALVHGIELTLPIARQI